MQRHRFVCIAAAAVLALPAITFAAAPPRQAPAEITVKFPKGTATPDEECGVCHRSFYNEYKFGYDRLAGAPQGDHTKPPAPPVTTSATKIAAPDDTPSHAAEATSLGLACGSCHSPEAFALPEMDLPEGSRPKGGKEATGKMTCATCHLTPEGKVRGPYNLRAPHDAYSDVKMKTSLMCASCHALGKRVAGKQTQTFLEWRDDYFRTGIGSQSCPGCHMPRALRKITDEAGTPMRVAGRHTMIGGEASLRLHDALTQVIVQPSPAASAFEIHVTNVGAGHSVPTGAVRKAIIVNVEAKNEEGKIVASERWLFAPWYASRPDDKKHLESDKKLPNSKMAIMADSQGPHEAPIRAGEERVLTWKPELKPGTYTITSRIVSDANRFTAKKDLSTLSEIGTVSIKAELGEKSRPPVKLR